MLAKIKLFFDEQLAPDAAVDSEHAVQLAACALLFEMVKADFQISASELQTMRVSQLPMHRSHYLTVSIHPFDQRQLFRGTETETGKGAVDDRLCRRPYRQIRGALPAQTGRPALYFSLGIYSDQAGGTARAKPPQLVIAFQ